MNSLNSGSIFLSKDEQKKLNLLFLEGSSVRRAAVITNINNSLVTQYFQKLRKAIHNQVMGESFRRMVSKNTERFNHLTNTKTSYAVTASYA